MEIELKGSPASIHISENADDPVIVDDGVEFEVVWSGRDTLIGPRDSLPDPTWEPPRRIYTKKSDYWDDRPSKKWTFQPCVNNEHDRCPGTTEDEGVCKCACHRIIVQEEGE